VEVIAVVRGAIYLLTEDDELFWLTLDTRPMHRRSMQLRQRLPRLTTGGMYAVRERSLMADSGNGFDFSLFPTWKAACLPPGKIVEYRQIPARVASLFARLYAAAEPARMSSLLLPVDDIGRACREHDFDRLREFTTALVGRGEGLTPCGDDFLGGLLFSLCLLHDAYPELSCLDCWNYVDFIEQCRSLTNPISYALLKDHADGHTLEPLHCLSIGLLTGQPVDSLLPFAWELMTVGHSTGWCILSGFLTGMGVTCAYDKAI
jgi:hypothetical protein